MKIRNIFNIIFALVIILLFSNSAKAIDINSSTTISSSGNYDVINSFVGTIIIAKDTDNVYINMNNHIIDGDTHYAFDIKGNQNITIENGWVVEKSFYLSYGLVNLTLKDIKTTGGTNAWTIYAWTDLNTSSIVNITNISAKTPHFLVVYNGGLTIKMQNSYIENSQDEILAGNGLNSNSFFTNNIFNISGNGVDSLNELPTGSVDRNYYEINKNCVDNNGNGICDNSFNLSLIQNGTYGNGQCCYNTIDNNPIKDSSLIYNYTSNNSDYSTYGSSQYFDSEQCSNPTDTKFLFCDKFNYNENINYYSWVYNHNETNYFPMYIAGSKRLNLSFTPSVSHYAGASFHPYDNGWSAEFDQTPFNTNAKEVRLSFDLIPTETGGLQWGMSSTTLNDILEEDLPEDLYFEDYGMITYAWGFYNNINKGIYLMNYTSGQYILLYILPNYNVTTHIETFVKHNSNWNENEITYCDYYITIRQGSSTFTSLIYEAGLQPPVPALSYCSCYFLKSVWFNADTGGVAIDNIEVYKTLSSYTLNGHVLKCSRTNPLDQIPIETNIEIYNGTIFNGYTTSNSQGYFTKEVSEEKSYLLKVNYENIINYFYLNSTASHYIPDLCFYTDDNQTTPPTNETGVDNPNDLFYLLSRMFTNFGVLSTASKMLIAVVIIIGVIIAIVFGIPAISPIIIVIITFLMIALFTIFNFIPIWVDIMIIIGSIAGIIFLSRKSGD